MHSATKSEISPDTCDVLKMQQQLQEFVTELPAMFLFLRCLKGVKIMEWNENSNTPTPLYHYFYHVLLFFIYFMTYHIYEVQISREETIRGTSESLFEGIKVYFYFCLFSF